jgi:hypothetical protein
LRGWDRAEAPSDRHDPHRTARIDPDRTELLDAIPAEDDRTALMGALPNDTDRTALIDAVPVEAGPTKRIPPHDDHVDDRAMDDYPDDDDWPMDDPVADDAPPPPRSPTPVASRHWWQRSLLVLLAVALQLALYTNSGFSWHFFMDAGSLLLGQHPPGLTAPGGLHLYANYPQFQFGPLALLATVALRPFADGGWLIITWLMTLCGLVVLYLLEYIVRTIRPLVDEDYRATIVTVLVGGGSFVFSWELLAVHFGHLDDVLALLLITMATLAVVYDAPIIAGVCIGLATDAKPWALAFFALLLLFSGRMRWRAVLVAGCVIVVAWLPFVLADPHTLSAAGTFGIPNVRQSALRALGVNSAMTPSWDRVAQFVVGGGLGVVAIYRRRWEAVIGLAIGARLVLDPSVAAYYTAGLALGLLLWDLTGYRRPMPILSVVCFFGITITNFVTKNAPLLGELRLWTVVIVCGVMLFAPRPAPALTGIA